MYRLQEEVELILPSGSEEKVALLRPVTKEEWAVRYQKRQTLIKDLGRGQSENKLLNKEEADLELLLKIQINKDVVFDGYEAATLIEQLATADVMDVIKESGAYTVVLNTILGETSHTVKIPSHKELKLCAEATAKVRGERFGSSKVIINPLPAVELYDKCFESCEGYDPLDKSLIPLPHKYKIVDAMQGEIINLRASGRREGTNFQ